MAGRPRNGSLRTPKPRGEFDFADHRLAIRHQRQRPVETLDLGAGDVDPVELALEGAGVGRKLDRNEGTAHGRARRRGFQLRHVEAEIAEDAAHPAHARFHAVFDRVERRHLAALDLVERGLQADQNVVDALDLGELVGLDGGDDRRARFQPRLAVRRRHEDHGVADRRRFRRARRRRIVGRGTPRRRPDRSGDAGIRNGAERGGARFQRGLAAHDLVEFLVELFLVEQLAAGGAIDFGAQFGDAVLVGVLHLGLAGDQPGQDVVAEREIGRGRRRPHAEHGHGADHDPEHHRSEPDLLAGMDQRIAVLRRRGRGRRRGLARRRAASGCPAMVMWMVLRVLGIMTGTVRHRHSRAGRTRVPYGQIYGADLTFSWLIFSEWNRSNHSARTAASTSSAWPSTLTLRQILRIRPSAPIRTVVRRMPRKVLPYMDFSPQTP